MTTTALATYEVWYTQAQRRDDAGLAGTHAGAGLDARQGTAHARLYGCADHLHRTLITTPAKETPHADYRRHPGRPGTVG